MLLLLLLLPWCMAQQQQQQQQEGTTSTIVSCLAVDVGQAIQGSSSSKACMGMTGSALLLRQRQQQLLLGVVIMLHTGQALVTYQDTQQLSSSSMLVVMSKGSHMIISMNMIHALQVIMWSSKNTQCLGLVVTLVKLATGTITCITWHSSSSSITMVAAAVVVTRGPCIIRITIILIT